MCGIVGYIGKTKHALNVLIDGLEHLEYRGYDSSGIAYILDDKIVIKKEVGHIQNLKKIIDFRYESNLGIGHTRWATHGKANIINSHPHKYKDITIVHNGIIENYLELKQSLLNKGYEFISETDTEVAAALLYDLYKDSTDMLLAIKKFKKIVIGTYAILVICDKDLESIYAIKKNSPLIIGIGTDGYYLGSDILAFIKYTNKYVTMDDYEYAKVSNNNLVLYSPKNVERKYDIKTIDITNQLIDKGGYSHYMLKEINEEPIIINKNANISNLINIKKYKKIVIVGCGSAMHAGLIGAYLFREYADIDTIVEIASEFRYKKLFLDKNTLVIAISQSGETADTLEAIKIAKEYGSYTVGIVNVKDSTIARNVDKVIYTEAGVEIAVATTKAYLAQVNVLIQLVAKSLMNKKLITEYYNDLKTIPFIIQKTIDNNIQYQNIAKKIYKSKHIFFIGRGIDYAISLEGSLKLKEISYIHSEAYAAGELKHGTISLIEDGTPVVGIVTDAKIADKTISNLKEVKARGAYVIYITTNRLYKNGDFFDDKIVVDSVNVLLQSLVTIVPLQLLAYYVANLNKCNIDKPRNLAKSVTVE